MKVAVIGGGTAGFIAAAQISRRFPEIDLVHIYDTSLPAIGVGEGTTPPFRVWLEKTLAHPFDPDLNGASVTRKYGIRFENWGASPSGKDGRRATFHHNFYPLRESFAYHIDARELVEWLEPCVVATRLDRKVTNLRGDGISATIGFADETELTVDLAIDARGFPTNLVEAEHIRFDVIPTNCALVGQGPPRPGQTMTRAVARPHGWIFAIPLQSRTSYGYVFNEVLSTPTQVGADLDDFLRRDGAGEALNRRTIRFPNFCRRRFFDGAILHLGNAAAFFEPLEATAIGFIVLQMNAFSAWPLEHLVAQSARRRPLDLRNLQTFNNYILGKLHELALFIGWHYAQGSRYATPFWRYARANWEREWASWPHPGSRRRFAAFLQAGSCTRASRDEARLVAEAFAVGEERKLTDFAGWPVASFAEIGHGIGYYA